MTVISSWRCRLSKVFRVLREIYGNFSRSRFWVLGGRGVSFSASSGPPPKTAYLLLCSENSRSGFMRYRCNNSSIYSFVPLSSRPTFMSTPSASEMPCGAPFPPRPKAIVTILSSVDRIPGCQTLLYSLRVGRYQSSHIYNFIHHRGSGMGRALIGV